LQNSRSACVTPAAGILAFCCCLLYEKLLPHFNSSSAAVIYLSSPFSPRSFYLMAAIRLSSWCGVELKHFSFIREENIRPTLFLRNYVTLIFTFGTKKATSFTGGIAGSVSVIVEEIVTTALFGNGVTDGVAVTINYFCTTGIKVGILMVVR
jgi:hypothetical protein